ncbi:response regulator transcription factor [Candidatus Gracilibacteria bacterium]|nr:response regulator transcription factor [Candidatus Gracilibacteria bacterium]
MPTILLIEDALDLAEIMRRELVAAGYAVTHAADGVAGIERFGREKPDLVVLDWMLPKRDGLDVLRTIRQAGTTPVLMLTARSEEADRVIGLELGADDYLVKPFGMRELHARVRALLRRSEVTTALLKADQTPTPVLLRYAGLVLDPQAHRATLDGAALELSPTEFQLLQLLLRSPGRAFGRAYLLDTIWGQQYVGGDRTVDNAMLRLRKKLGAVGEAIETVWGVGYRLREL